MEELLSILLQEIVKEQQYGPYTYLNDVVGEEVDEDPETPSLAHLLAAKLLAKGVQLPEQSGYTNGVEPYDIPGDLD